MFLTRLLGFLIIVLILSYARENAILIINGEIYDTGSYKANVPAPDWLQAISSKGQLLKIKLIVNFLFSILFLAHLCVSVLVCFKSKKEFVIILKGSLIVVLLLILLSGINLITSDELSKSLIRWALSLIQSPFPFIITSAYLYYQLGDFKSRN